MRAAAIDAVIAGGAPRASSAYIGKLADLLLLAPGKEAAGGVQIGQPCVPVADGAAQPLLHDVPQHTRQRWLTYRRRWAAGDLFLGPYAVDMLLRRMT